MQRFQDGALLWSEQGLDASSSQSLRLRAPGALLVCAGTLCVLVPQAAAQVQGEQVQRGSARFERLNNRTVIRAADGTIINYQRFDVRAGESVQFIQPNSNARVLNRIQSAAPTRIDGQLTANGQVYLVNRAGVVFGQGSIVNGSRIVAAAGDISNADFLARRDRFTRVQGDIVNDGAIMANNVTLVGATIANHGSIVAGADGAGNQRGVVTLASGGEVFVQEQGSAIRVQVDKAVTHRADDTRQQPQPTIAIRSAKRRFTSLGAGDAAAHALAIRNTGTVQAHGGTVTIVAASGTVRNDGTIASNSPSSSDTAARGSVRIVAPIIDQADSVDVRTLAHSQVQTSDEGGLTRGATIELHATDALIVHPNARLLAADQTLATTSTISLQSKGDLTIAQGSTIDAGQGIIALSGDRSMHIAGNLHAAASPDVGQPGGQLLLGGDNAGSIYVRQVGAQDAQLSDGTITRQDVGEQTFIVSANSIENFAGDVLLSTPLDIVIEQSIAKTNGGLTLDAGREIVFGRQSPPGAEPDTGLIDVGIAAQFLDFSSNAAIRDLTQSGAQLTALAGNINLASATAGAHFGRASVVSGRTITWTQSQSLTLASADARIAQSQSTNLVLNITSGTLQLGSAAPASTGGQTYQSFSATANGLIEVRETITTASSIDLYSQGNLRVSASLFAPNRVALVAGISGTGNLSFDAPDLTVGSTRVLLRAGSTPLSSTVNRPVPQGSINLATNAPMFIGPSGTGTSPSFFEFSQNQGFTDASLPSGQQFGAGTTSINYLAQSYYESIQINDGSSLQGTNATLNAHSAFNPIEPGALVVNTDLDLVSFASLGVVELFANITTQNEQFYEDRVLLGADVTLRASHVQFEAPVTSLDGGSTKSLTIDADATFEVGVGDLRPLRELRVLGDATIGRTDVTADDFLVRMLTESNQSYQGNLRMLTDTQLRVLNQGDIRIGADVLGGLSALIARPLNLDVQTNAGLIILGGDIGVNAPIGQLFLSTSADPVARPVPDAATIIATSNATIRAREVRFAQGEKFTVLGNLDLQADRVSIGDINTLGTLKIAADTISLLRRPASTLRDRVGQLLSDLGLDFVAGGNINFEGTIELAGEGTSESSLPAPRFGSGTGTYSASLDPFERVTMLPAEVALGAFQGPSSEVLDLRVPVRDLDDVAHPDASGVQYAALDRRHAPQELGRVDTHQSPLA